MSSQLPDSEDIGVCDLEQLPSNAYGPSFSDDLEALHAQEIETRFQNNSRGVVIQHRSWTLSDVFHSEPDPRKGRLILPA